MVTKESRERRETGGDEMTCSRFTREGQQFSTSEHRDGWRDWRYSPLHSSDNLAVGSFIVREGRLCLVP